MDMPVHGRRGNSGFRGCLILISERFGSVELLSACCKPVSRRCLQDRSLGVVKKRFVLQMSALQDLRPGNQSSNSTCVLKSREKEICQV